MTYCSYCAIALHGEHEICPHHFMHGDADPNWHENNRVMCEILNRGKPWPPRLSLAEREDLLWGDFDRTLDESTKREVPDTPESKYI